MHGFHVCGDTFACRFAFLYFLIKRCGNSSGPAPVCYACHHNRVFVRPITYPNLVANPDLFSTFDTFIVDVHLATIDRIGRQATRFEESRGPQPLIEPNLLIHVLGRLLVVIQPVICHLSRSCQLIGPQPTSKHRSTHQPR
jgi:hypothetical protein